MKKVIILIFLLSLLPIFAEEDLPSIILPKIDIEFEDIKQIDLESMIKESSLPDIEFDTIPKPDFTEAIKIDLEKTLPQKIDSPEKQKPIDALIIFGYGLNNNLFADFSIFVKQYNPKFSIHYLRLAKETLWFDRTYMKNPTSLDDLKAELIYFYKNFNLGAELGYFAHSYKLQKKSVYDSLTKRILNVDFGPSLKFNFQNDITFRVLNSFLFTNCEGTVEDDELVKRADFDYILQTDIVYTQVFGNNHFFTSHIGYDFNYLDTLTDGGKEDLASQHNNYFFNNIKAGAGYSTTLKDSFLLKTSIDFLGMFRGTEFFWYILTINKFGYSFQDYFHCYIEGGGKLIEKPEQFWFKGHDYVIFPADITPGYHWFVKTGIKGSFTGWFSAHTDFEFAYNQYAFDWDTSSNEEKLYTLKSFSFMELNLEAGIKFNVKEYFELKIDWLHSFYKKDIFLRMHLRARDNLLTSIKWAIPKIGLSFFITFEGRFYRLDLDNKEMGNIYLMNAGIDWSWQERIGLGTKFNNILYFQNYQLMPGYDEPGFEVLGYIKVGF